MMMGLILTTIGHYEAEKKFTKELASKHQLDHLFFLAHNDLMKMLSTDTQSFEDGTLYYMNGSVAYKVVEREEPAIRIEMKATSANQNGKSAVIAVYDVNETEAKVVQWFE